MGLAETFIQSALEDSDSLSTVGLKRSEALLETRHNELRAARQALTAAQNAQSEQMARQAELSNRVTQLRAKAADKHGLVNIELNALPAAAKRAGELAQLLAYTLLALEVEVCAGSLPAQIAVKEAALDIDKAEVEWLKQSAVITIRKVYRPLAQAAAHDPNLEVNLTSNSTITILLKDIGERRARIDAMTAEIEKDQHFFSQQKALLGL